MSEHCQKTAVKPEPRPYQAPAVHDLGPWKAMTLIYSLPIGPGGSRPAGGNSNVW